MKRQHQHGGGYRPAENVLVAVGGVELKWVRSEEEGHSRPQDGLADRPEGDEEGAQRYDEDDHVTGPDARVAGCSLQERVGPEEEYPSTLPGVERPVHVHDQIRTVLAKEALCALPAELWRSLRVP